MGHATTAAGQRRAAQCTVQQSTAAPNGRDEDGKESLEIPFFFLLPHRSSSSSVCVVREGRQEAGVISDQAAAAGIAGSRKAPAGCDAPDAPDAPDAGAPECKSEGAPVHECKEAERGLGDRSALVRPILPALDSFRVLARLLLVLAVWVRLWASGVRAGPGWR